MSDTAPAAPSTPAAPASTPNTPTATSSASGAAPPASAPPDAGESTSPPPAPKRFALKFGDRTEEVTEEQLIHRAQKAYGAEQAFREAAEIRKQQADFQAALKDPAKAREYISKYGGDPDGLLKAWALDWHKAQEMTPEQKELQAERQRAEAAEAKLQEAEQTRAQQAFQAQEQEAHARYVDTFSAAISQVVPGAKPEAVSPRLIAAMAHWQQANLATAKGAPPEVVAQETVETALADGLAALDLFEANPAEMVKRMGPKRMALLVNEYVRQLDERAGVTASKTQTRPVVVNGDRPRNGDGTFRPSGRETREAESFKRFINGGGL